MSTTTVAISGFSSDSGKTTLLCELLRAFPGWEAIKVTRGHYRSCGKDPHTCCVSHLLSTEPVLRSGREATYAKGKDTGRYWDAGAANVHWLVVTSEQVEQGISQALAMVRAPGVFIEGTSFLNYLKVDFSLMVARAGGGRIKTSARRVLDKASALYLSDEACALPATLSEKFSAQRLTAGVDEALRTLPVYTPQDLPAIIERIRGLQQAVTAL